MARTGAVNTDTETIAIHAIRAETCLKQATQGEICCYTCIDTQFIMSMSPRYKAIYIDAQIEDLIFFVMLNKITP